MYDPAKFEAIRKAIKSDMMREKVHADAITAIIGVIDITEQITHSLFAISLQLEQLEQNTRPR